MSFERDMIRNLLIDSVHSKAEAKEFFEYHLDDKDLLELLLEIAIDDHSGDARMEASYWVSQFNSHELKKFEPQLLKLQSDELDSVSCHIFLALGKIKSKEGLRYLIEERIKPQLYWESEALKLHLQNFLN